MQNLLNFKLAYYLIFVFFGIFLSACTRDIEDNSNTTKVVKSPILEQQQNLIVDNPKPEHVANYEAEKPKNVKTTTYCQLPANIQDENYLDNNISFKQWLAIFKNEAISIGLSDTTIAALSNINPIQKVIDLDRSQAEYSTTFFQYLNNSISAARIATGKQMLNKYRTLLTNIKEQYGVQPQVLIALWAMESNFGKNMGNFSTINTLATLAHDGRRPNFFRNELLCALHIIEQKHIFAADMKSSWAGAMGQPQFMPSTFYYYAVDGDKDGKKDIWHNVTDVFASAANYLKEMGWQFEQDWGLEVKLPNNFDFYQASLAEQKSLQEWHELGVTKANGQALSGNTKGSIMLPSGGEGPAFLVLQNFRVLREWNRSINYALTVGHLSDRLVDKDRIIGKAPKDEKPLSRQEILTLQRNLQILGFYHDKIDGMIGLHSRTAIREYQKSRGLPADAYPSQLVIVRLQQDVAQLSLKNHK
jgi:membrane-bound lytic murein transglycosylase B